MWEITVEKTGGYVVSRVILAVSAQIATSSFLLIINIPYWLPLGIWTGVISQFIPTIGTYLGGAFPALFGFSASTWDGIVVWYSSSCISRSRTILHTTHQQPHDEHPSRSRIRGRDHGWRSRRGTMAR